MIMANGADVGRLPEAVICDLAGCAQPTRQSWVKRGLLSPCRGGCTVLDLIELHVVSKLLALIGPRDTAFVWAELRSQLRAAAMTGDIVDIVVDLQSKRATLVQDADGLLVAVRTEHLTRVIPLSADVTRLRSDFRRLLEISRTKPVDTPRRGRDHQSGSQPGS